MRHDPLPVHGVAREAAAELVVHPASRHRLAGRADHRASGDRAGAPRVAQELLEHHRRRELGRAAEARLLAVEVRGEPGHRGVEHGDVDRRRDAGHGPVQVRAEVGGHLADVVGPLGPRLVDRLEHLAERRHALARRVREVGAGEERAAVVVEHHRHRPAAVPRHRGRGLHVDRVDVRPLLAVDLDADEVLVEVRRRRRVLEGLVRHHVAPVARGVPDAQQHRQSPLARLGKGVLAPLPPVDRVVGVLEEVRGRGGRQAVRHARHATTALVEDGAPAPVTRPRETSEDLSPGLVTGLRSSSTNGLAD